jgi:hypothetical protein
VEGDELAATEIARLDIGKVVNRTFGAIGANFISFFVLSLLLSALPALLLSLAPRFLLPILAQSMDRYALSGVSSLLTFSATLLSLVPAYIVTGALTQGSLAHFNGRKATLGECLVTGLRFVLPLIGLGVLAFLGLFLWALPALIPYALLDAIVANNPLVVVPAAVVFLIPAIMAFIRWTVSAPALVSERVGIFSAFRRSAELTRNTRWRVFWLYVIYFVIAVLIDVAFNFAISQIGFSAFLDAGLAFWVFQGVALIYSALNTMIGSTGIAAVYFELRVTKEGVTADQLAKVFD